VILDIPDVSEQEASDYIKNRGLDKEEALKLYKLFGGRVVQLEEAIDRIKLGMPFEGMAQSA
jgi:hypothetical protein